MTQRIAVYVPSLRGGGTERMMVNLVNSIAERGHVVDLILARAEGPYLDQVVVGVNIVDLQASRVLFSLPGLIRYLKREKPSATLSALRHTNIVAVIARLIARVPTRLILSERNIPIVDGRLATILKQQWLRVLARWVYPWAQGFVAISQGVAQNLASSIDLSIDKITIIYNPVVDSRIQILAQQPIPHSWLAPDQFPIILGVGRLTEIKDFPTLIRAFAQIRRQRPCRLIILGEGEQRNELEALIANLGLDKDVILPGFQENPFAWMSRAAVFVLSSVSEGFGNVLVEAMACGTPVVSTDCPGGPAVILEGGKWGRLVPVGNVDALEYAIAETLDEPNPPAVQSRAAFFSVERSVEAYLSVMMGKA